MLFIDTTHLAAEKRLSAKSHVMLTGSFIDLSKRMFKYSKKFFSSQNIQSAALEENILLLHAACDFGGQKQCLD